MRKKRLEGKNPRLRPVLDVSDLDERTIHLIGYPGYRNARGRSGLGYVETRAELAYMQGLMLRWLFTGNFRTHNPIYLFFMFMYGMICGVIPLGLILYESFAGKPGMAVVLLSLLPYLAIGNALFVNTILSFVNWEGKSITGD